MSFFPVIQLALVPTGDSTAIEMIQLLGERKKHSVTPEQKEKIFQASGGHPGLILALLTVLIEKPYSFQKIDLQDWANELPARLAGLYISELVKAGQQDIDAEEVWLDHIPYWCPTCGMAVQGCTTGKCVMPAFPASELEQP